MGIAFAPQLFAGDRWLTSLDQAEKIARAKNQLIFVDLFAEWCGWCHRMESDVFPTAEFQKATSNMVLLRLDTEDRKEGTQFARTYEITQLPTFLVLEPDLSLAGTIRGYAPAPQFVYQMKLVIAENAQYRKLVGDEAAIANDYSKRLTLIEEMIDRRSFADADKRVKKLISEKATPAEIRSEAYYQLAFLQVKQRKFDDAVSTIHDCTTRKHGDAVERCYLLLGQIDLSQGKLKDALDEFVRFKVRFPDSPHVREIDSFLPQLETAVANAAAAQGQ